MAARSVPISGKVVSMPSRAISSEVYALSDERSGLCKVSRLVPQVHAALVFQAGRGSQTERNSTHLRPDVVSPMGLEPAWLSNLGADRGLA